MHSSSPVPQVPDAAPSMIVSPPSATPALASASQAQSAPSLLVLEDDNFTQKLLRQMLEKSGYAVTTAGDGIDALLHLGRERFDLIISDINMPNLNGLQLLEIKNQKGVDVPVIFLTADETEESEQKCLELGAIDYIKKPVNKDILLLRIQKALARL
jgi:DNA-binding response OmpR family regulator